MTDSWTPAAPAPLDPLRALLQEWLDCAPYQPHTGFEEWYKGFRARVKAALGAVQAERATTNPAPVSNSLVVGQEPERMRLAQLMDEMMTADIEHSAYNRARWLMEHGVRLSGANEETPHEDGNIQCECDACVAYRGDYRGDSL